MKRADLATSLVLIPIDYFLLVSAGLTSYALRYQPVITQFRPVFFEFPFSEFLPSLLIFAFVGVVIFAFGGSYAIQSRYKVSEIFSKAFLGVSTTVLLVIVAVFFKRELFSSRFVVIIAWLLAVVYVSMGRLLVVALKAFLLKKGYGVHHLILIGSGRPIEDIRRYFEDNHHVGYAIVAAFQRLDHDAQQAIAQMVKGNAADEILETRDSATREDLAEALQFCHIHNLSFRYIAGLSQTRALNFETDSIAGYPIIQINKTPLTGWGRVYKRLLDIVLAFPASILLLPLFLIIVAAIRIDSRGPALIRLQRIGRAGRVFRMYKFRSMIVGAHTMKAQFAQYNERSDGPLFKMANDPRITRVGRFLRMMSLDELPQLWNVIRGDMSLVGPRPHEPEEVEHYRPNYRSLISIRPGITGLAQVSGRSNLSFEDEARLDLYYIENWSLLLDIRILLKTFYVVITLRDVA
ncbi:MAG TPA: hypothetical protein DIS62_05655 [Candidatus Kerfeldbacteria bacterium]|nr:hypothetical protein [Candidatus Kerfeldbacteria bacterium]